MKNGPSPGGRKREVPGGCATAGGAVLGARSRTEYETPEGTDPEEIPRRQSWNLLRGHAQNTKQAQLKDY